MRDLPDHQPGDAPEYSGEIPASRPQQPKSKTGLIVAVIVIASLLLIAALVVAPGLVLKSHYDAHARRDRAKVDIKILETAVMKYFVDNGVYPQSLQILTQPDPNGNRAALELKDLIDPWNQPYVFDPSQLDQRTGRPRIFSQGPPGENLPINNW
jgi:hypothetical protein